MTQKNFYKLKEATSLKIIITKRRRGSPVVEITKVIMLLISLKKLKMLSFLTLSSHYRLLDICQDSVTFRKLITKLHPMSQVVIFLKLKT
jgi:hypothetical protein